MITEIDNAAALVLIDFQKSNVAVELAHPVKDILANATELLHAFHQKNLPVIVVNVNPIGAAWTKARAENKTAMPTDEKAIESASSVADELQIQPSDVRLTKHTWNAFFETNLHALLQEKSVTQIVLAGISTSIGVEGTARAASELSYNIAFATDAMTDRVAAAHNNSLQYIFPRIGELGSAKEIIEKMK